MYFSCLCTWNYPAHQGKKSHIYIYIFIHKSYLPNLILSNELFINDFNMSSIYNSLNFLCGYCKSLSNLIFSASCYFLAMYLIFLTH